MDGRCRQSSSTKQKHHAARHGSWQLFVLPPLIVHLDYAIALIPFNGVWLAFCRGRFQNGLRPSHQPFVTRWMMSPSRRGAQQKASSNAVTGNQGSPSKSTMRHYCLALAELNPYKLYAVNSVPSTQSAHPMAPCPVSCLGRQPLRSPPPGIVLRPAASWLERHRLSVYTRPDAAIKLCLQSTEYGVVHAVFGMHGGQSRAGCCRTD